MRETPQTAFLMALSHLVCMCVHELPRVSDIYELVFLKGVAVSILLSSQSFYNLLVKIHNHNQPQQNNT